MCSFCIFVTEADIEKHYTFKHVSLSNLGVIVIIHDLDLSRVKGFNFYWTAPDWYDIPILHLHIVGSRFNRKPVYGVQTVTMVTDGIGHLVEHWTLKHRNKYCKERGE